MSRYRRRAVAIAAGAIAVAPMVSACAAGRSPQTALPTQLVEGVNASRGNLAIRNVFVLGPEPGQRLPVGGAAPVYAWIVAGGTAPDRLVGVDAPGVAQSVEIAGGTLNLPPNTLVPTNLAESPRPAPGRPAPGVTPSAKPTTTATRPIKPTKPAHGKKPPGGTPTAGAPGAATPSTAPTGAPGSSAPTTTGAPSGTQGSAIVLTGLTRALSGGETLRLTFHFQRSGAITLSVPVELQQGYYATYAPAPSTPQTGTPTTPGQPFASPSGSATPAKPAKSKKPSPSPTA